ncbi:hypothetical protein EON64_13660, partial [archaeon]
MYQYCEAYFAAVNRWRLSEQTDLLANRLELLEAVHDIFEEYCECDETYEFQVVWEHENVGLRDEYSPSELEYSVDADTRAFQAAKQLVPSAMFNKAGIFFQNHVLKPLAGFSEERLARCNPRTRRSAVLACEHVLRLPLEGGR